MQNGSIRHIINTLGPGLLFSGTAIGVSHLVMSSRAGASYGLIMIFVVIIANLFKYPFFKFGPVYAAATGRDLLDGYESIGHKALILFLIFTLITFFVFIAAVSNVTAGIALNILNINISTLTASFIILVICGIILSYGHYHYLVLVIKLLIIILTVSTFTAFIMALYIKLSTHNIDQYIDGGASSLFQESSIPFIIALMGWMPAPIEISVWQSIWQLEKKVDDPSAGSMQGALLDFNIGYLYTAIIAMLFVCLGAFVLYGSNITLPSTAIGFANVLITLYTETLGSWSWYIIAAACFATMFSTTLTLLDGYARVLHKAIDLAYNNRFKHNSYNLWLVVSIILSLIVLVYFINNMRALTMFATILSFITAPVFAYLNYKVISSSNLNSKYQLTNLDLVLSKSGILFLTIVSIAFCVYFVLDLFVI